MTRLFFDIETLPAKEEDFAVLEEIYTNKKLKNPEFTKTLEEFIDSTGLAGTFGRLFCISYAFDNQPVQNLHGPEETMLAEFWKLLPRADLLIGHNILNFDLPFLKQRSIINRIKPAPVSLRKYSPSPVFDTMQEWNCYAWADGWSSLDVIAKALKLTSSKDGGLDGSKVAQYYKEGKTKEIIDYCNADVELTRKIYCRMTFTELENSRLF